MALPQASFDPGPEDSAREMALLLRVVSAANRSFSVDELAETSLNASRSAVPVDLAFFLLIDPRAACLRLAPRTKAPGSSSVW